MCDYFRLAPCDIAKTQYFILGADLGLILGAYTYAGDRTNLNDGRFYRTNGMDGIMDGNMDGNMDGCAASSL